MVKMFRKRLNNRKGFTLIELLVVVAIIGILAAIAIPKFQNANASARGARIMADLRTLDSASQLYYASAGSYTTSLTALTAANVLAAVPTPPTGAYITPNVSSGTNSTTTYSLSSSGRAQLGTSAVENF